MSEVVPREYCPHCGFVTESELRGIVCGTLVYCKQCHRVLETIWDTTTAADEGENDE